MMNTLITGAAGFIGFHLAKKLHSDGENLILVDNFARGRVYYGDEGKELNLIDIVGEFNDAINLAADLADFEEYQIIEYPKQKTEIERIISSLQQTKSVLDPFIKNNWLIESMIKNDFYDPFQMRMEYRID